MCRLSFRQRPYEQEEQENTERDIAFFMFKFQSPWCKFKGERDAIILYDICLPLLTVLRSLSVIECLKGNRY